MSPRQKRQFNLPRAIRPIGFLLLVIGFANIWYGDRRNDRYEVLLVEGEAKLADPEVNMNQQERYVRRLKARLAFYNTVENGGRIMVGLAIILIGVTSAFSTKINNELGDAPQRPAKS